jgi:glycosyltransferase involved in cell wall biosynthesis
MNQCDEIWTPSPLIAEWYKRFAGIDVPVHVYEHGIEADWSPVKREPADYIKFLHVGAEATRKGGWDTVRLFRRAFNGYRDDVKLTLKMIHSSWAKVPSLGKVQYLNGRMSKAQMLHLYQHHDVFVYPSWGEGFGLTPFQAMATGMPTILPPAWAPYKRFTDPKLSVRVDFVRSPWQDIHPGKMLRPNSDDIIEAMRYAADNYEQARDFACSNAFEIHKEYNWNDLTRKAFSDLENRLK